MFYIIQQIRGDIMKMHIGFKRKCAFFSRLAVLFRLHVPEGEQRSVSDYRQVYPVLYRTISGYGMPENPKDFIGDLTRLGPVQIQRRALHEVFMSALRAEYYDVAIRHLCYLLQVRNLSLFIANKDLTDPCVPARCS
ncbi:unnamed protein product [Gongylonema pulchrum]|uniref:RICTOR_N domain-containing protein n=1 Tax=Gongylonema pulchrum TaxID=637853 RepID=A0A183DLJ0_9BILA|nr:unnamed protein product [Gongylonema pulchrum]